MNQDDRIEVLLNGISSQIKLLREEIDEALTELEVRIIAIEAYIERKEKA